MNKKCKYSMGEVLINTNNNNQVILLRRYDIKSSQRCAWWVRTHPDGIEEFALPEDELKNH